MMKLRKAVFITCIVLLTSLFIEGLFYLSLDSVDERIKYKNNNFSGRNIQYSSNGTDRAINLLILGLDENDERSDVIVLLNFNPQSGQLNLLSVPRDTKVFVNGAGLKINALVAIGGERLMVEKIGELTGLPVWFYLTLNFKGFRQIIDELGGVEMNIENDMIYDDPEQNLHIRLKKGNMLLDGKKAEQFVRYRKGNKPGTGYEFGDLGRMKAQQEFIKALISQKFRLKYLLKINELFMIFKENVRTNMEIGDISHLSDAFEKLKSNEVRAFSLPGDSKYINKVWYFVSDEEKTAELVGKNFYR